MSLPGKIAVPIEPHVQIAEELDDRANRRRLIGIAAFVVVSVAVSLAVYLSMRPPNRHFEATPYDNIIGLLRKSMSEEDVLALFRLAGEGNARVQFGASDEISTSGKRRVVTYRIDSDEALTVRLGGPTGRTVSEWCYRDHCYNNIE